MLDRKLLSGYGYNLFLSEIMLDDVCAMVAHFDSHARAWTSHFDTQVRSFEPLGLGRYEETKRKTRTSVVISDDIHPETSASGRYDKPNI